MKFTREEIVDDFENNGANIFVHIYVEVFPSVKRYVLQNSGTKEDAEDLFQEALIKAYQNWQSGKWVNVEKYGAYIFGVCRNIWFKKLAKEKKLGYKVSIEDFLLLNEDDSFTILDWEKYGDEDAHLTNKDFQYLLIEEALRLFPEIKDGANVQLRCRDLMPHIFEKKKVVAEKLNRSLHFTKKKFTVCRKRLRENIKNSDFYHRFKNHPVFLKYLKEDTKD